MLTPEQKAEAAKKLKTMNEELAQEEELKNTMSNSILIQKKLPKTFDRLLLPSRLMTKSSLISSEKSSIKMYSTLNSVTQQN